MAKANRLDALQATGGAIGPMVTTSSRARKLCKRCLPKASAIKWAVANWDNGASWDTVA